MQKSLSLRELDRSDSLSTEHPTGQQTPSLGELLPQCLKNKRLVAFAGQEAEQALLQADRKVCSLVYLPVSGNKLVVHMWVGKPLTCFSWYSSLYQATQREKRSGHPTARKH